MGIDRGALVRWVMRWVVDKGRRRSAGHAGKEGTSKFILRKMSGYVFEYTCSGSMMGKDRIRLHMLFG